MDTNEAVLEIAEELKKIGLEIVTQYICKNIEAYQGETAIIVASFPDRACVVCFEVFHTYSRYHVTLQINGQLDGAGMASLRLKVEKHDCFYESESPDGAFSRQFRLAKAAATLEQHIKACIIFCSNFLEANRGILADRFSIVPLLPLAPVTTEEYNKAACSMSRTAAQEYFERKVLPILPKKIMPPAAQLK